MTNAAPPPPPGSSTVAPGPTSGPSAIGTGVAAAFPPAEARAARTSEDAQRLAWRVLGAAFVAWLVLVAGAVYGAAAWVHTSTVTAPARLAVIQGVVLLQERETGPLLNARDGMPLQEGDALEVRDNALARLELPGTATLHLGSRARLVLAKLRAGRFAPEAGAVELQQPAGGVRVLVAAGAPVPLALETPYGTVVLGPGDYVVAVDGPRAQVLVRDGAATVSVGDNPPLALRTGERAHLAPNTPVTGPFQGGANLLANGDFAAGLEGWQPRDTQEANRPDRLGERAVVREEVDRTPRAALRVTRQSAFQTHNETGVVQQLDADVSVYPRLVLSGWVKVRSANLSGGGYLGTEYPLMLRLRYRDTAGNGQAWYRGFYYRNPERRPTERGQLVPEDAWVRFELDLAELPELPAPPAFLYALEVLGAGHDFEALVADLRLVPE